jgi:putative protein-disulfide isomerase
LVTASQEMPGLTLQLHCGGLFIGRNVRRVTDEMRDFILAQDARITAMTGQWFGPGYRANLQSSAELLLDSAPASRAILAASRLGGLGPAMLHAIHQAHYVDGKRITDAETLVALAEEIGLSGEAFAGIQETITNQDLDREVATSRTLMGKHGVSSLPTFILERDDTQTILDHQRYYGKPQAWRALLQESLQRLVH